jgi:signal transduction histidine kinase
MNDLIGVLALPGAWGNDPSRIIRELLDALLNLLRLDFAYARLDGFGGAYTDWARVDIVRNSALALSDIRGIVNSLDGDQKNWLDRRLVNVGDRRMSIVSVPLGLQGEIGVLVSASDRSSFPEETERLVLNVGANQAVVGLQAARLLEGAEEALRNTHAKLSNMARLSTLGELTASITHELKQPLSGIVTNANTCLRMLGAEQPNIEGARETARRTIRDGNRASQIVTRLRALFGERNISIEPFDLNEATREIISLFAEKLRESQLLLRTQFEGRIPIIHGDRVQIQQVIMNLLQNALDAMIDIDDREKHILVTTSLGEGDWVTLAVKDSGCGFDPKDVDRLFEPFYTTKREGMGFGLSVCRSIVESHKGRLWATPNVGSSGATFLFSIPFNSEVQPRLGPRS